MSSTLRATSTPALMPVQRILGSSNETYWLVAKELLSLLDRSEAIEFIEQSIETDGHVPTRTILPW